MLQHRVQFTLQKVAIAWMFALVTINYVRVAVVDLGVAALLVTVMIGLYPFFGPLQPIFGRITERFPVAGYRRTPYLLLGFFSGSIIFPFLPRLTVALSEGNQGALVWLFLLFFVFGISIALMANTFLDLLADVTTEESRSKVTASAWTGQTLAIAAWAFVFQWLMPTFSLENMQLLYGITPVVVMVIGFLSVVGLEPRYGESKANQGESIVTENPLAQMQESLRVMAESRMATRFFLFVGLAMFAVFLQDSLQEVMGGELFGMTVGETTIFQKIFNSTVAVGMTLGAVVGTVRLGEKIDGSWHLSMDAKKRIASIGGVGAVFGFSLIALGAWQELLPLVLWAMAFNGVCIGVFTFGSVTMMADMTVAGRTGRYLGVWSLAQAVGLGLSFIVAGALHALLIGSGWLSLPAAYATFFGINGLFVAACVWAVQPASVAVLRRDAAAA